MKFVCPPTDAQYLERIYQTQIQDDNLPYLDGVLAQSFFGDLAAQAPHLRDFLMTQVLPLLAGPLPLEEKRRVIANVAASALAAGYTSTFTHHDIRVIQRNLADFIRAVNQSTSERTVVFVAGSPYFLILREAMYLRRNGWRCFLVSLSVVPDRLKALFEANFEAIADTRRSLRLMRSLLARLHPDIFHVQCWMWLYSIGRMTMEARGKSKVVCEFYDITSTYAERDVLCQGFKPATVDFDLYMEKFILHHADAVITRFPQSAIEEWAERHGASPLHLAMQSWPCSEFAGRPTRDKPSRKDGIFRLVYAGGLVPVDDNHPPVLFPEAGMPDGFRTLLEQGIAIDIFHVPHGDPTDESNSPFAKYYELQRQFPSFRLRSGVPPHQFAEAMAPYDFGILLFNYHPDARVRESQRKGVMATKLFSYIEAGIPALVNAEYEAMAGFLEQHGIGMGIGSADLPRLRDILKAYDYDQVLENIRIFQEKYSMEKEILPLIKLYNQLIDG